MPRNRSEKETPRIKSVRAYRDFLARYIKACDAIGFNARGDRYYTGENQDVLQLKHEVQNARSSGLVPRDAHGPLWSTHLEHLNTYLKEHA